MIRSSYRKARLLHLVAVAAVLALAVAPAAAQTRPFVIAGVGVGSEGLPLPGQPARPLVIVGLAPYLGLHTGAGEVQVDTAVPDPTVGDFGGIVGNFHGKFTFQSQNGDKLDCNYGDINAGAAEAGSFVLTVVGATDQGVPIVEASFLAEFVVNPNTSTGKLKGVTGSWLMYAQSEPFVLGSSDPVNYGWVGEGTLKFPK